MKTKDKMPEINRDYPESDVSGNQRLKQDTEKDQQNKKGGNIKGTNAHIENLPEIKPARTGILG